MLLKLFAVHALLLQISSAIDTRSQRLGRLTQTDDAQPVANCSAIRRWFATGGSGSNQQDSSAPSCRCYSVGHRDMDQSDPTWIRCEKSNMYPIVNIFNRLPNNTRISKLSIVDCAMPIVSAALLTNVRPLQLRIEASTVRELAPDLFAQVGQRLKVIELKNNNLKKISARQFDKLEKLTTLDLSGNNLTQLTSKSFGSIASLERLFVQRNNISHVEDYTFAQLVNLKVLSLASNRIQRITANTLAGLGSLEILSFENNTITEIDANAFLHTPKLQQLNLGSNSIDRLSLQHLPNLRTLFIHQNRFVSLASITTGSRQLLNLESFYMDKNNVTEVADTDLKQMPSLVTLSLNQNLITRIDPDAFVASQSLASLSLENNRLSLLADSVFQPLQQLRILQLSHNAIESIGERTFARLRNLRKLVLSHNHIADVDDAAFSEMYALERLYLDSNLIKTLKNGTFANFEPRRMNTIDLSNNTWKCDCSLVWLAQWLQANKKLAQHVDKMRCSFGTSLVAVESIVDREQQQQASSPKKLHSEKLTIFDGVAQLTCIEDANGQTIAAPAPHSLWITVVGLVLAIASLLAITAIVVLYIHDYRQNGGYLLFSRNAAFDLRRVPSDMVNLIGQHSSTKVAQQQQPNSSILATGARTNRAIDESIMQSHNQNRMTPVHKQKLVRFNDESTQQLQPIVEEASERTFVST